MCEVLKQTSIMFSASRLRRLRTESVRAGSQKTGKEEVFVRDSRVKDRYQ